MNFSVQPARRIASNLLWTPAGFVRDPLVTLAADGRILGVERCSAPDRLPATEFYAGVLVPGFPTAFRETFRSMCADAPAPLAGQLGVVAPVPDGVLVVISGLDYTSMRLTAASRIERIG